MADMQPTESKMFSHYGYADGELHLIFSNGGKTYAFPVTEEEYKDFLSATSKGGWYHQNLRAKKVAGRKVEALDA